MLVSPQLQISFAAYSHDICDIWQERKYVIKDWGFLTVSERRKCGKRDNANISVHLMSNSMAPPTELSSNKPSHNPSPLLIPVKHARSGALHIGKPNHKPSHLGALGSPHILSDHFPPSKAITVPRSTDWAPSGLTHALLNPQFPTRPRSRDRSHGADSVAPRRHVVQRWNGAPPESLQWKTEATFHRRGRNGKNGAGTGQGNDPRAGSSALRAAVWHRPAHAHEESSPSDIVWHVTVWAVTRRGGTGRGWAHRDGEVNVGTASVTSARCRYKYRQVYVWLSGASGFGGTGQCGGGMHL